MAMVNVFANFAIILNNMGISAVIIQKKDLSDRQLSSYYWINLMEGMVVTLIFASLAPFISSFYNEPRLVSITLVISTTFTINSLGTVQHALFSKRMDFKLISIVEIFSLLLGGIVAVVMAFTGYGIWSLVLQSIVTMSVGAVILIILSPWKPYFKLRVSDIRDILSFSLNMMGFNVVNYFSRNLDNLIIGKYLGSESLGVYNLAYRLMLFPLYNITVVVGKVMFPALSSIQEDEDKFRQTYILSNQYIAIVTFPLMVGLLIVAPQFVRVALGAKWTGAIIIIQVLALIGMVQSIVSSIGWIYLSHGRPDIMLKWSLVSTAFSVAAFAIGLHWGVEGVAIGYSIVTILLFYPAMAIPFRLIGLKFLRFLRSFTGIVLSIACMGALTFGARIFLERVLDVPDIVTLIVTVLVGVASYSSFLWLFERNLLRGAGELLASLKAGKKPLLENENEG